MVSTCAFYGYLVIVVGAAVSEQNGDVGARWSVASTLHKHLSPQLAQGLGSVRCSAPVPRPRDSLLDVVPGVELIQVEDDVGAVAERHQADV